MPPSSARGSRQAALLDSVLSAGPVHDAHLGGFVQVTGPARKYLAAAKGSFILARSPARRCAPPHICVRRSRPGGRIAVGAGSRRVDGDPGLGGLAPDLHGRPEPRRILEGPGLDEGHPRPGPRVCFTPGGKCTDLVVSEIAGARQAILVQAYSFTSVPILAALKAAHARGIDVQVIVDKTAARESKKGSRYSAATYLTNAGIPVWVDTKVAIAHNKVMVIDGATIVSRSW
jgi:phosphatidylserine/phosphatidylglycerophosphate/cardiolipin synthase-like enzyme